MNGDRVLRAQLGTTKYCSAWLRHETCTNRQCMFLHELAEEEDSYTRQDLSSINGINAQKPIPSAAGSSRSASRQQSHPSPAPAAAQPMIRSSSKDGSDHGDGPALPATANWARNPQVRSRRGSHATSGAAPSPAISNALPVTAESAIEDEPPADVPAPVPGPSTAAPALAPAPAPAPPSAPTPVPAAAAPVTRTKSAKTPAERAKRTTQDTLKSLLKSLEGCSLAWPKTSAEQDDNSKYPPLFDSRGGERRRAMRESEAASTTGDQLTASVREPSEGEPESSGSLALGGEPEDRDHVRDTHGFDPRRTAQPPIQRGSGDGFFGQAVGSGMAQSTTNLGSIGTASRTMTPQQQSFMRPPTGFVEHLAAQTNTLFQGQGHNRQGSRFSFANDNRDAASSTSVKLTGNPRIMAQQSSMMPSSFQHQAGNQYYGSSMPPPPPGLKSTGTPPGMFGQHGFGLTAFGGASKDNDLMQQLINRNRGAGAQAHDSGKREYTFSFNPNQYPPSNSSTPAPASNHLGSLFASQPGAFQDMGSKQKKKGKKHRNANTSSSGGSGIVDLADPSILQARMQSHQQSLQHQQQTLQQQSNGGLGPGVFGGQSQEDDLLSLEEFRPSIDALVADEPIDVNLRHPPGGFEIFGRTGTPSAPPGLPIPPSVQHSPAISHASLHTVNFGRQTPSVASPKVSSKAATSAAPSPLISKRTITPSASEAKNIIKALAAESGLSKEIAKAKTPKIVTLQDEDFPALNSPKASAVATPLATPKPTPGKASSSKKLTGEIAPEKSAKKTKKEEKKERKEREKAERAERLEREKAEKAEKERLRAEEREKEKEKAAAAAASAKAAPVKVLETSSTATAPKASEKPPASTADKKNDKRPVPGILNIAAATKVSQIRNLEAPSASTKSATTEKDSAFPALPTPTPASVSSPLSRAAPKTLRLVATPKTETPSTPVMGGGPSLPPPSARSSAAASAHRPETPASELISDSASIISASISASRTNSPPPSSRIGSAPTRTTTKSQQRKQRKELTKKESAVLAAQPVKPEPEVEIGPIIGRKKKQKKEKEKPVAAPTTAKSTSEPPAASPAPPTKETKESKEVKEVKEESSTYRSTANETTTLTGEPTHKNRYDSTTPDGSSQQSAAVPREGPLPHEILQSLHDSGLVPENLEKLAFFQPATVPLDRWKNDINAAGLWELAAKNTMTPTKNMVTEEDQAILLSGKPVRKVVDGVRILITPNGDCVRNLTADEEERFLELQNEIAEESASPASFVSARHETGSGFSLVKGRAVPNGPPSYFPQGKGAFPSDPVNKIQREEAIYYINQYVLPRLNLNSRDMSFPKAISNWTGQGGSGNAGQQQAQANAAAAANLGAMAPWLYGAGGPGMPGQGAHDMADAVAPELSYPGPVGAFAEAGSSPGGFASYLEGGIDGEQNQRHVPPGAGGPAGPFGNVPLMSLEDAEQALSAARKEAEKLERSFVSLVKKNRKLLLSSGTGLGGHH
ncbi:general negative regulator of transcription subunit 4 [Cercophora samala]|uniref:General negative regulator of transcription subunit 4 n=1 Tax=Cercophora samala TaxID=330535 RepID=A0AA40D9E1_9PEZI|nr:general negative regulator of transcription subunit 4 [Cercophora samala]